MGLWIIWVKCRLNILLFVRERLICSRWSGILRCFGNFISFHHSLSRFWLFWLFCWGSARFAAGYRSRIWTCECESVPRFWFWVWLFDVNSCRRYDFHRFVRYEVVLLKEKRILDKNKVPTTYLYRLAATGTNKLSSTSRISAPIKRDNETFNYVNWLEQSLCISVLTNINFSKALKNPTVRKASQSYAFEIFLHIHWVVSRL